MHLQNFHDLYPCGNNIFFFQKFMFGNNFIISTNIFIYFILIQIYLNIGCILIIIFSTFSINL